MNRVRYITQSGTIAATYAAATILTAQLLGGLAWGLIQLRVSEALTVLAFFTPAAVPGLALGSVIANAYNSVVTGNPFGMLDVVFGSLGTLLAAVWTWRFRERTVLGLAGPVIANALIVPAYLPLMLKGYGLYKVPLLGLDVEGSWIAMYLFGVVSVGIGQAIVMYGLGWPFLGALRKLNLGDILGKGSKG